MRKALLRYVLSLVALVAALAGFSVRADDIDIYSGGGLVTGNKPNVVFLVDNTANWNTIFSDEKAALVSTVDGLPADAFRMGLLLFTETGGDNNNVDGAYIRYHVRDMDATNKANLSGIVNNLDILADKSNSGKLGKTMYEAYLYLSGANAYAGYDKAKTDPAAFTSGTVAGPTYVSPVVSGCQKNFIIYISNGPAQDAASDTTYAQNALIAAGGSMTPTLTLSPNSSQDNVGDEWARFLAQQADLSATLANSQSAIIYTVDVLPGTTGQGPGWTALLKSVASQGKGRYFAITASGGSVNDQLKAALSEILLEIQAVNSVFTSASLPVSVNTQGTYLNQIYIGMFRPDGQSKPRWLGNLKQYKIARNSATGSIFLADANGNVATNSATGFVSPNAVSFWTTRESDVTASPATGYWSALPYGEGGAGGSYNSPDGDIVEKGGAAQKLREQFATGRNVLTCYPSCTTNTTPASFATSNGSLTTRLAPGSPKTITSLSRTGGTDTANATTSTAHGLSVGDNITIEYVDVSDPASDPDVGIPGADFSNYNGSYSVASVPSTTQFTYTVVTSPTTPATGAGITAALSSGTPATATLSSLTYNSVTGLATATLASHGLITGQLVTIAGATQTQYNVTNAVITKVNDNSFTYAPTLTTVETPAAVNASPASPPAMSCTSGTTQAHTLAQIFRPAGLTNTKVFVVTSGNSTNGINKCTVGASTSITYTGYTGNHSIVACPAYSGAYASAPNVNSKTFCFDISVTSAPVAPATPATGAITATYLPTRAVTSMTRSLATVTVTTSVAHGFSTGNTVTIAGATESEYNGTFSITWLSSTSFRYSLIYQRPAQTVAAGRINGSYNGHAATVTKGGSSEVSAANLINWIRGSDVQDEYNRADVSGIGLGNTTEVRPSIHGDVLHSRPVVIDYGNKLDSGGVNKIGQVAFYGANDGTFHAVTAGQDDLTTTADNGIAFGKEKWAFVADETFDTLQRLYLNSPVVKYFSTPSGISPPPTQRSYFVDGSVSAYQTQDISKVIVFMSARRGGRFVYAFDVTDPDAPTFLWRFSNADHSALGQTWSTPQVAQVKGNVNPVVIFGAGYDAAQEDKAPGSARTATMGYGLFVVDAFTGTLVKFMDPYVASSENKYSIPSDVRLIDSDFDGYVDRVYAGDTGANVWRFDLDDATPANWASYKLAALGRALPTTTDGVDDRKILFPPEAVLAGGYTAVLVTTGNREYPIDIVGMRPGVTTVVNRAYMIKDTYTGKSALGMTPVVHSTPNASGNTKVTTTVATTLLADEIRTGPVSSIAVGNSVDALAMADGINPVDITDRKGWSLTMANDGEKGVNAPLSISGIVFFGSNQPEAPSANSCNANLGVARGYGVDVFTGQAAFDRDGDGKVDAHDLYSVFTGGGLPPSPVTGTVLVDGSPVRFIIGSGVASGVSRHGASSEICTVNCDADGTGGGSGGGAGLDPLDLGKATTGPRKRTFWYIQND